MREILLDFSSAHLDDLDLLGGKRCRLLHHIHDPRSIRLSHPPLRGGHSQTDGILTDEGHTVGISFGRDHHWFYDYDDSQKCGVCELRYACQHCDLLSKFCIYPV